MKTTITLLTFALLAASPALALDDIVRPYESIRTAGMGGVYLTTGTYDQNFYGNPARVLDNPKGKVSLFDLMAEVNGSSISHVGDLTSSSGNDIYGKMGDTAGSNNHVRLQTVFPAFYIPAKDGKLAYAIGLMTSTQGNFDLRRNFQTEPNFITDVGPAVTIGRRMNESLNLGLTAHADYRIATSSQFTLIDVIKGNSISAGTLLGQGAHFDADVGATYALPFTWTGAKWSAGASINNLLGGNNSSVNLISGITLAAPPQPRTLGFGASASWEKVSVFSDVVAAFEVQDIGNNANGSLFRTLHLGAEGHYGVFTPRLGFNQGYLAAGVGVDLHVLTLDFATYGEEMSLNAGGLEDRRFSFKIALEL